MMTAKEILVAAKLERSFWGKRIIAAEKRGYSSDSDEKFASSWTTCACGRLDKRIPGIEDGDGPDDVKLRVAGQRFADAIDAYSMLEAAEYLVAIEKRAKQILARLDK